MQSRSLTDDTLGHDVAKPVQVEGIGNRYSRTGRCRFTMARQLLATVLAELGHEADEGPEVQLVRGVLE